MALPTDQFSTLAGKVKTNYTLLVNLAAREFLAWLTFSVIAYALIDNPATTPLFVVWSLITWAIVTSSFIISHQWRKIAEIKQGIQTPTQ